MREVNILYNQVVTKRKRNFQNLAIFRALFRSQFLWRAIGSPTCRAGVITSCCFQALTQLLLANAATQGCQQAVGCKGLSV
jgi:hypothetical protein